MFWIVSSAIGRSNEVIGPVLSNDSSTDILYVDRYPWASWVLFLCNESAGEVFQQDVVSVRDTPARHLNEARPCS